MEVQVRRGVHAGSAGINQGHGIGGHLGMYEEGRQPRNELTL